jgi:DEAD/DEAH box helicase
MASAKTLSKAQQKDADQLEASKRGVTVAQVRQDRKQKHSSSSLSSPTAVSKNDATAATKPKRPKIQKELETAQDDEHVREIKRLRAYSKDENDHVEQSASSSGGNGAATSSLAKRRTRSMDAKEDYDAEATKSAAADATAILSVPEWRQQHGMVLRGHGTLSNTSSFPDPFQTFDATPFNGTLRAAIATAGFVAPSPIQAQSWPCALQGTDLICVAKTGSGSTLSVCVVCLDMCIDASICPLCTGVSRVFLLLPTSK